MMSQYVCPCCSEPLLIHVKADQQIGFCLKCHQEMPLIEQYGMTATTSPEVQPNSVVDIIDILLKNKQNLNSLLQDEIYGLWILDRNLKTQFTNQKLGGILGYAVVELQGQPLWKFVDEQETFYQALYSHQVLHQSEQYELKLRHAGGNWVWVQLSVTALMDEDQHCQAYVCRVLDLTDFKQIRHRIKQQTQRETAMSRILQVIRNSAQLTTIFEAVVKEIGQVLPVISAQIVQYLPQQDRWIHQAEYRPTLNSSPAQFKIKQLIKADHTLEMSKDQKLLKLPLKVTKQGLYSGNLKIDVEQIPCFLQDYPGAWLPIPIYSQNSIWGCLSFVMEDPNYDWQEHDYFLVQTVANQLAIAIDKAEIYYQLNQANQQLNNISTLDEVTQLPNRYYFNQKLQQTWQQLASSQSHLALILCYVNSFSDYQVNYGDRHGNEYLKHLAFILRSGLNHPNQWVARYATAEFALLLPHTELAQAVDLMNRLQTQINQIQTTIPQISPSMNPTVSFGMASLIPQLSLSPQRLLMTAEQALNQSASPLSHCLLPSA